MKNNNLKMLENIYDIIKIVGLSDSQNDEWATLSRKHANEARKEFKKFIKRKTITLDFDKKNITIGKHFIINLK